MPTRAQLKKFQNSFQNIGNEAMITRENFMHVEEVELPETDPPTPFPEGLDVPEPVDEFGLPPLSSNLETEIPADSLMVKQQILYL